VSPGATLLDLRSTWAPEDRARRQCQEVPFEVPAGVDAIWVGLELDRSGQAVLDLGLEGPDGYRGWSGGARDHAVISARWCTPGYLPGPVTPGVWTVLVGLHRVPPPGVPARVLVRALTRAEVEAERAATAVPAPPVPEAPPRRDLPSVDGLHWLAGDFHAHTLHSDGALSVAQLAALAASRGLDFLAVTDHNTTSHHGERGATGEHYGIRLLPGQEVTTDRGHANAFGDIGFVDFRAPAAVWQRTVADRGGVLSVNHPLAGDCSWQLELAEPTRVAELWHSSWLLRSWGGPLAWWRAWGSATVPIGGSDFHRAGADALPGAPTTWVLCEDGDVLDGVAAGRTAVSAAPDGPLLLRCGDELVVLGADGALLTGFERGRRVLHGDTVRLPAGPGPWWVEDDQMRVLALCA
jgi:hypothetical protein